MAREQRAVPGASEPSRLLAGFKGDGRLHLGRAALPGESAAPPESANASPHPRCPPRSARPTRRESPTSAGRERGSVDWVLSVPPAGALLLAPGARPLHVARPLFHTDDRNPVQSLPHQRACVWRWPSRHSGRPLPTLLTGYSACTAASGRARAMLRGLTSPQGLLPLRGPPAPLPTAAWLDTYSPGQ